MLERLERSYLGLLRVFILVLATCALMAAGGALITAVTEKVRASHAESGPTTGGDLSSYIQQQKDLEAGSERGSNEDELRLESVEPNVLPDIRTAAKNLVTYIGKRGVISQGQMALLLQEKADALGNHGPAYATDLKALTEQLKASKGAPLSLKRLDGLVDWHFANYKVAIEQQNAEAAEAKANLQIALGAMAAALVTFLLTIFVFIFVKIERNLRLVRTIAAPAAEIEHA